MNTPQLHALRAYFTEHPIDFSGLTPPGVPPASPTPSVRKTRRKKSILPPGSGPDEQDSVNPPGSGVDAPDPVDIEAERRVVEALGTIIPAPAPLDGVHRGQKGLDISRMYGNTILFGHDPLEGIVAVEFTDPNIITVYLRDAAGVTGNTSCRFSPFMWEETPEAGSSLMLPRRFVTWRDLRCAYDRNARQRVLWDHAQQYLTTSGRTLFKGLRFEELRRLQVDIETSCAAGYEMSNPARDQIIAIAVSDSTGWETLLLGEEAAMLRSLSALITERDPDVIEGHHFFNFDLPFMLARSLKLKVPLLWGRDGSHLYCEERQGNMHKVKVNVANTPLDVLAFRVRGRHLIDTMILAALYDTAFRRLPNLKLKSVAAALGVQEKDRVILAGDEIQRAFSSDREVFAAYALGDVRETRAISALLSPSYFIQAQMFPMSYQNVVLTGTATRVNSLLLREYLRVGQPVPAPPPVRKYRGALCEIHQRGVIKRVCHCDVSSLYPTTMLFFECLPKSDTLGVLRAALTDQRDYRLRAKRLADSTADDGLKTSLGALQNAFKTLINSSYGYLGTPGMNFSDYEAAEMVTAVGRNLIGRIRDWLLARGCAPIELDTDGIFFSLPPQVDRKTLSVELNASLPHGMSVEFDCEYGVMVSCRMKNYALLDAGGRIIIKGSSLRSRGSEPFLSRYKAEVLRMLLTGEEDDIPALFDCTVRALRNRELPLEDLARTQTLKDSIQEYLAKVARGGRRQDAAYEATIAAGRSVVRGDKVAYYVTCPRDGEKKGGPVYMRAKLVPPETGDRIRDEDVECYIAKLENAAKTFDDFAPHV